MAISLVALFLSLIGLWCLVAGLDFNWDLLNYHYYGPFQLLSQRLGQDYFAASTQGYFNPLVYLPFYLMNQWGWHSGVIVLVLATLHGLNLWLIWLVTGALLKKDDPYRAALQFLATALAFVTPLYLTVLGTSFADPLTSVLVLASIALLLRLHQSERAVQFLAFAGLAMGIAVGLKLTNGFFLVCACACSLVVPAAARTARLNRVLIFGLAAALGLVLSHGYWSYQLWKEYENPVFPLFNHLFASPDFTQSMTEDRRYVNDDWLKLFSLPVRMVVHSTRVYSENLAPDLRPLLLCIVLAIAFLTPPIRTRIFFSGGKSATTGVELPALSWLTFLWVLSFAVWAYIAGIGRYALPLWLLVAPLLVVWAYLALGLRAARWLACATLALQLAMLLALGNPRLAANEWQARWLDIDVPVRYREQPFLYLSIGPQTHALIVPFLHPDAQVVNLVGQYVQPAGSDMTARLRQLLDRHPSRIKVVTPLLRPLLPDQRHPDAIREYYSSVLSIYGLMMTDEPCDLIELRYKALPPWAFYNPFDTKRPEAEGGKLAVCSVSALDGQAHRQLLAELQAIDQVFDRVEQACGDVLSPHGVQTLRQGESWGRWYMNTLTGLRITGDRVLLYRHGSWQDHDLGPVSDWFASTHVARCPDTQTLASGEFR
ncbi:MAG TPA: hypothetical protein VNJ47_12790 [Nevskiales bacterium]|nr:hypothetical protein [Nevskiales bacterium]